MSNERITEELTRSKFRELGYYHADSPEMVEEQKSQNAEIKRLLTKASKTGKQGRGAPEFIVTSPETPDFVLIVECKAETRRHSSTPGEFAWTRPNDFAVDGVLHYASFLRASFNVIAVAVSGQTSEELEISSFVWPKGNESPRELKTPDDALINDLVPWQEFVKAGEFDPEVAKSRERDLMAFSRELHEFMWKHAKLTESQKPLLVSGTLIALQNRPFAASYGTYSTPEKLQNAWMTAITEVIEQAEIPNSKISAMVQPYSSIAVHPELKKISGEFPRGVLFELITRLHDRVWPFISVYHDFDVVGQFYGEFLKYTGGDKKALGIVLTPRHVTELFALLANVTKRDVVVDTCTGTGGFLIGAMKEMMRGAVTDRERARIRQHGLVGVEQQPDMFALAASNMILRGDGKANLHQGSCFDPGIVNAIKNHKGTVGMINPPYAQKEFELHELRFVKHLLDQLQPGAIGIAIVPMSCATSPSAHKAALLKDHTLQAVMSMPDELFYPVGVITCVMVFKAHTPHLAARRKTWFGFWKNDGFIKTKHLGRIDPDDRWPEIRDRWVEMYRNREVHAGESVQQMVTADDEWCAEAYMETDYSRLSQDDFERVVRNYAIFRMLGSLTQGTAEDA